MNNDTPDDVEARVRELFAQRSGSERVRMMSDMFDCARALMVSNIEATWPGVTPGELRIKLFERLYRNELEAGHYQAVLRRLRRSAMVD